MGPLLIGRAGGDFQPGTRVGQVLDQRLAELSGIAASRANAGVLWVHNDRARDQVYAVDTRGQLLAVWRLNRSGEDFEDIAIGPGPLPELNYLYCADIGDNSATRRSIRVFRAGEPAVYQSQAAAAALSSRTLPLVEGITFTYPDGSRNAEALLVDPGTGDLYIATKESGRCRLYRAASAQLQADAIVVLGFVMELKFDIVSAGDISPDGREIILRQEEYARYWQRPPGQTIAQALSGNPAPVPVIGTPTEPNGEGVAFAADGSGYFTISEGAQPAVYFFARSSTSRPVRERTFIPSASIWRYRDDGSDQGIAWRMPDFDDGSWPAGPAQFGYGDQDEQTVLRSGDDRDRKTVTTYFRKQFVVADPGRIASLRVRVVYDDGIALYLNGAEVLRRNLDAEARFSVPALASSGATENLWQTFPIPNLLRPGTNTLAAEVHRFSLAEEDLSFDLQLFAMEELRFMGTPRRVTPTRWSFEFYAPDHAPLYLETSSDLRDWAGLGSVSSQDGTGSISVSAVEPLGHFYRLRQ